MSGVRFGSMVRKTQTNQNQITQRKTSTEGVTFFFFFLSEVAFSVIFT